jgi:hypothetical protein
MVIYFDQTCEVWMSRARLVAFAALLCGASALRPSVSRRSALALLPFGVAPLAVAPKGAQAKAKEGAADDYLAKAKARQEASAAAYAEAAASPQPGKVSFKQSQSTAGVPATFKEMLQKSVEQREAATGMSMSDTEIVDLEAKMRKAFPGVK